MPAPVLARRHVHPDPVRAGQLARARAQLELEELEAFAYLAGAPDPRPPHRDPLPHEAHVDFAGVAADLDNVTSLAAARALKLRPQILDRLLALLADHQIDSATAALRLLTALELTGPASVPGVSADVAAAAAEIGTHLVGLASRSAGRVQAEALAQGVPADLITTATLRTDVLAQIGANASRTAAAPAAQVLAAARTAAAGSAGPNQPADGVTEAIVAAVADLSDAGVEDLAHQAANQSNGLGRSDGAGSIGGGLQASIYASELNDSRTCVPCALVDGTEYATEADALQDYPAGQYAACSGGPRCRGMLVYVWSAESPATVGMPF